MNREALDLTFVPSKTRAAVWQAALDEFAIETTGACADGPAHLRIVRSPSGFVFSRVRASDQILRPASGISGAMFWCNIVLAGAARAIIENEPVRLTRGNILFGQRGSAGHLEIGEDFEMLMVNIPIDVVRRKQVNLLPNKTLWLETSSGAGRLMSSILLELAGELETLDDAGFIAIEAAIIPLLTATIASTYHEREPRGSARAYLSTMQRLCNSIDQRLRDSELSIQQVAQLNGLKVRYIQRLFHRQGETFRNYIRRRRLERCREMLSDPAEADLSITSICLHWGFNDPAYFSRNFRQEYGVSAIEFRRSALAPHA